MEMYIHYKSLPQGKDLHDVVGELNEVLEDERVNPKHAQVAVKAYLQRAEFPRDTTVEIGCMEIGIYE